MINSAGACPSKLMLVGECPNAEEDKARSAFVGYSMNEFNKMLMQVGLPLGSMFRTHVLRTRPFGGDISALIALKKKDISPSHVLLRDKYVLDPIPAHIDMLRRDIEMCRPNVIIASGNLAMWALTGKWGVGSWRGSSLECNLDLALDYKPKVIPIYAAQQINKVFSWRPIYLHDLQKVKREMGSAEYVRPEYNFILRPDFATVLAVLHQLLNQLEEPKFLGVDIETRAWNIECIALAWSTRDAICIPFITADGSHYWCEEDEVAIVYLLYKLLSHKNCWILGQGFAYDDQYIFRKWHFSPNLKRDTLIAQHSLYSEMPKDLSFLSSMYIPHHTHWKDERDSFGNEQRWRYNCKDAVITYEIDQGQREAIANAKMTEVESFQQTLYHPVMNAMRRGILVDLSEREKFDQELCSLIQERENYIEYVVGRPLNVNSPKQMVDFFYRELNQKKRTKRGTGSLTCDDEALWKICEKNVILKPLVTAITELRSLRVFLKTFVRCQLSEGNRLRCEYKIGGTKTYRFASNSNAFGEGTNFQNIPDGQRSTIDLPNVRKLFIPDPGHTFFDIDLDSADLRIVAWEAELTEMIAMLAEGKKVYVEVMKEYFKNPNMTKHDKEYTMFKSLCHGTHYLGTPQGLALRLGLLVHEIETISKWYHGKFPGLKVWQDSVRDQVFKRKKVTNVLGYQKYFFDRINEATIREAIAWIPQSTVACIINRAFVDLYENHRSLVEVLLQVHDSLGGQFKTEDKEKVCKIIVKAAEVKLPYEKPLVIPAEVHTSELSWGHCK